MGHILFSSEQCIFSPALFPFCVKYVFFCPLFTVLSPGVRVAFKYWQLILEIKARAFRGWRGCRFAHGRICGAEIRGSVFFSVRSLWCMPGPSRVRENLEEVLPLNDS